LEGINRDKTCIESGVHAEERSDHLGRDVVTTREREVRMPRAKIWLEGSGERGVGHAFVQLEQVRMSVTDTEPDNFRAAFGGEGSDPVERKKKARESNREQLAAQLLLSFGCHISDKRKREMKLFCRQPADTGQVRIQIRERLRN
jgi:hypothetical protein